LPKVDVLPRHNVVLPVIGPGKGVTVIVAFAWQPALVVNLIAAWPGDTPVSTPVLASIVATAGVRLLHVPAALLLNVIVAPIHTVVSPVMGDMGFTVTVVFALAVTPQASVTVPVYTVVLVGETTAGLPATGPGVHDHVYGATPKVPVPLRVDVSPLHIVAGVALTVPPLPISTVRPVTVITNGWVR
jgi:hypothetical protein